MWNSAEQKRRGVVRALGKHAGGAFVDVDGDSSWW
jgi:hypothetical protein